MSGDDEVEMTVEEMSAEIIPATPWHNSDTVAASFMFAANMAAAASHHFQSLGMLALGQSAHEWAENDKVDFIEDTIGTIKGLVEGGDGDD